MQIAQEFKLQDVTITCPVTQQPLATGVQISASVYATSIFVNVRVVCPHCEGEHRWSNADAHLVEVERGAATPTQTFGRRAPRRPAPAQAAPQTPDEGSAPRPAEAPVS